MMQSDSFTAADICKIIKECAKSNVSELKFGESFVVRFNEMAKPCETTDPEQASQDVNDIGVEEHLEVIDSSKKQMDSERVEEEIQNLLISDPYAFEELDSQGALENAEEKTG